MRRAPLCLSGQDYPGPEATTQRNAHMTRKTSEKWAARSTTRTPEAERSMADVSPLSLRQSVARFTITQET